MPSTPQWTCSCSKCGYDLSGVSRGCPECGVVFTAASEATFFHRIPWRRLVACWLVARGMFELLGLASLLYSQGQVMYPMLAQIPGADGRPSFDPDNLSFVGLRMYLAHIFREVPSLWTFLLRGMALLTCGSFGLWPRLDRHRLSNGLLLAGVVTDVLIGLWQTVAGLF